MHSQVDGELHCLGCSPWVKIFATSPRQVGRCLQFHEKDPVILQPAADSEVQDEMQDALPLTGLRRLFEVRKFLFLMQRARLLDPVEDALVSRRVLTHFDPKARFALFATMTQLRSCFEEVHLVERASQRPQEKLVQRERAFGLLAQHPLHSAEAARPRYHEQLLKRLQSPGPQRQAQHSARSFRSRRT